MTLNAYCTPRRQQGFKPLYDLHHAFIVQTHGRKRWSVWPHHVEYPMRGYEMDRFGHTGTPWEVTLDPGDVM